MKRRTKPTTLRIGVISEGTLRLEDLIPSMLRELGRIRLTADERKIAQRIRRECSSPEQIAADPEGAADDLDTLYQIAGYHAPDYCHVGSHEGDGACIGVWPNIDAAAEDAASITDTAELPNIDPSYRYALHVNDHGNTTLYRRAGTRWIEGGIR